MTTNSDILAIVDNALAALELSETESAYISGVLSMALHTVTVQAEIELAQAQRDANASERMRQDAQMKLDAMTMERNAAEAESMRWQKTIAEMNVELHELRKMLPGVKRVNMFDRGEMASEPTHSGVKVAGTREYMVPPGTDEL